MILEDWFTISVANIMSYSKVIFPNVLKIALYFAYLTEYSQGLHLACARPRFSCSI